MLAPSASPRALKDPAINQHLSAIGQVVNPGTPAEFAAAITEQRETVKKIGEVLGLKTAQ